MQQIISLRKSPAELERFIGYFSSHWHWSACKDFDLLKGYGNSHWGKKRQGRVG